MRFHQHDYELALAFARLADGYGGEDFSCTDQRVTTLHGTYAFSSFAGFDRGFATVRHKDGRFDVGDLQPRATGVWVASDGETTAFYGPECTELPVYIHPLPR